MEEYTHEFDKLVINCDLQEHEEQTIVRYLRRLDPRYGNVVDLQAYTTFDEVCALVHKVEQQKKSRPLKLEFPKPLLQNEPINKGSPIPFHKPTVRQPSTPQKTPAPLNSQPPPNKPKSISKGIQRCFKCQGFGHLASDLSLIHI